MILIVAGCSKEPCPSSAATPDSSSATDNGLPNKTPTPSKSANGIDVDLTVLSSTMVYSEVYNMMMQPKDYVGKTIKMAGKFSYYKDENTKRVYYACIIQDATACCSQGIEFETTADFSYPADFPKVDGQICVSGVFDTYEEGGQKYCTLRNAQILS